jgi:hypothetical protein
MRVAAGAARMGVTDMPMMCIECGLESISEHVLFGPYGICDNCEVT